MFLSLFLFHFWLIYDIFQGVIGILVTKSNPKVEFPVGPSLVKVSVSFSKLCHKQQLIIIFFVKHFRSRQIWVCTTTTKTFQSRDTYLFIGRLCRWIITLVWSNSLLLEDLQNVSWNFSSWQKSNKVIVQDVVHLTFLKVMDVRQTLKNYWILTDVVLTFNYLISGNFWLIQIFKSTVIRKIRSYIRDKLTQFITTINHIWYEWIGVRLETTSHLRTKLVC